MKRFNTTPFWGMISKFYDLLQAGDRDRYEYLWEGLSTISSEMVRAVSRYMLTTDPNQIPTQPQLGIYGVAIDIAASVPFNIDPTDSNSRSIFIAKKIIANPTANGRQDQIIVEKNIYDAFSDLATAKYAIIRDGVTTRFFNIIGLYVGANNAYYMQIRADLSYVASSAKVSFSISSGTIYAIDQSITSMPRLRTNIMDDTMPSTVFRSGVDYDFTAGRVEFVNDIVSSGLIYNGQSLFCEDVNVMESNMFNVWGSLTGLTDWSALDLDNVSAKAGITVLMKSLQNPSNVDDFERGLGILMGLQVAPQNGSVVGVFEEYDYVVTAVDTMTSTVTFEIKDDSPLHPFIQIGTKFIIDGTVDIVNVISLDRTLWQVVLDSASGITVGSVLNIQLRQRLPLISVTKPNLSNSYFTVAYHTDLSDIQHIISNYGNVAPVFFIGGGSGYDGLFHMYSAQLDGINHDIYIYDEWGSADVPLYNDFIVDAEVMATKNISGFLHMPWPTCKYVLLSLVDGTLYKVFVDSKVDTDLDSGDAVTKFQPMTNCLRVLDEREFPMWNEYDGFRMQNGIDLVLNALELVWSIPGAKTGINFPN